MIAHLPSFQGLLLWWGLSLNAGLSLFHLFHLFFTLLKTFFDGVGLGAVLAFFALKSAFFEVF